MDTVPWILGIAHPPGFPAYTLIGWAFAHAIPIGSVAFRMSLLSGVAMSAAALAVYGIVVRSGGDRVAGLCASWLFAAGLVAWTRATRAEVHSLETCAYALVLYFGLRWYDAPNVRDLFAAAFVFGTGVAIHPLALLMIPGLLLLLIARLHETETAWLAAAAVIALASAGIWYVYLPLRGAYVESHALDPTAAYGISGAAFWNYDRPQTRTGFVALVTGKGVDAADALRGYVRAKFVDGAVAWMRAATREVTLIGLMLALIGVWTAWRRDAMRTSGTIVCALASAAFAFGFGDESDVQRYYLPSFLMIACFAGIGVAALRRYDRHLGAGAAIAAFACVVWLIGTQRFIFNQPRDERARFDVSDVLRRTPDDAILVATWVLAPPLAYTTYVQHATGDRIVISAWYGDTADELCAWIARRPVYVVGTPEGSVPGFHLERLDARTKLYRVVPR
jgi:hypothetical protein